MIEKKTNLDPSVPTKSMISPATTLCAGGIKSTDQAITSVVSLQMEAAQYDLQ